MALLCWCASLLNCPEVSGWLTLPSRDTYFAATFPCVWQGKQRADPTWLRRAPRAGQLVAPADVSPSSMFCSRGAELYGQETLWLDRPWWPLGLQDQSRVTGRWAPSEERGFLCQGLRRKWTYCRAESQMLRGEGLLLLCFTLTSNLSHTDKIKLSDQKNNHARMPEQCQIAVKVSNCLLSVSPCLFTVR